MQSILINLLLLIVILHGQLNQQINQVPTAQWETHHYEPWNFSIKIHPNFAVKEKKKIVRDNIKFETASYSSTYGKVTINTIFEVVDFLDARPLMLKIFTNIENFQGKNLAQARSMWATIKPGSKMIALERFEQNGCIGIQDIGQEDNDYSRELTITDSKNKALNLSVHFIYPKEREREILSMIKTIECGEFSAR